ncbi:MAG: hypothetical protein KDA87_09780 [Planctomycetales bacterium]|nr:hypothetical protein [Planctomycetales bacterium]
MNYFAHGRNYVDSPWFLAGTAVPDWLNVVDRKVRARKRMALEYVDHEDAELAQVAQGVVQHHHDDDWFHRTAAFAELSWQFTVEIRDLLGQDAGLRPSFLGHILVELLLDSVLSQQQPAQLDAYYAALEKLDVDRVTSAVETITGKGVERLTVLLPRFNAERFLYDYADDERLLFRLNGVMKRVGLAQLPNQLVPWFSDARRRVAASEDNLLKPPPQS